MTKLSTTRPRHSAAAAAADSDYFSKTGKGPRHAVPRNSFISCAMNESDNRGRICKCLHELYCYYYGTYAIDLAIEWAGKRVFTIFACFEIVDNKEIRKKNRFRGIQVVLCS